MVFNSLTFMVFFAVDLLLHNLPFSGQVKKFNLLIDIYLGRVRPFPKRFDFALFVTFFTQLVAGPILRTSANPPIRSAAAFEPRPAAVGAGLQA